MKRLLLGNEALALGARAAGVTIATGYPGTPSTEILEHFARYPGVSAEWSVNEKVALEVGAGAALAGARTMVTMKHVGLNVAADPFFAAAYTGTNAGLVLICADDPGMDSSQGEQDNRSYAKFAKVPLLEPSDSQECFDMVAVALQLSEEFDTPVVLRTTGRVSHSQSVVEMAEDAFEVSEPGSARRFVPDPAKYVMLPANARRRRLALEERLGRLREYAESSPINHVLWQDRRLGIVADGVAYQYAREAFPEASILKLGMPYPFPNRLVTEFAAGVEMLLVVEELDPFLEEQIRALPPLAGKRIHGKDVLPNIGELSAAVVRARAVEHGLVPGPAPAPVAPAPLPLPPRPPVLCAGCPHRTTFHALSRMYVPPDLAAAPEGTRIPRERVIVTGDIGCYTLGALPPLSAMDTCTCMGASIGTALGMEMAGYRGRVVAVIGDGTFYHSGITGLVDVVAAGAATTVVIMDNNTTAMTGGNVNPGSGLHLDGTPAPRVDLESVCRGVGVRDVVVIDAYDLATVRSEIERALGTDEPTVLIVRGPCQLRVRGPSAEVALVEPATCNGCENCLRIGCPALIRSEGKVVVLPDMCTGCNLCVQVCPQNAISLRARERSQS